MKDWKSVLMQPDISIRMALSRIDKAATKIGLVVDSVGKLIGTVSDGDIRRAILAGISLDDPIEKCMCQNPVVTSAAESKESILTMMRNLGLYQIPVLDQDGFVVDLSVINDYLRIPNRQNRVVIMAGGLGSRLKELTAKTPKPMLVVGNKPILETIILNLVEQGFRKISIAVNYHADQIESYFGNGEPHGAEITFLHEPTRLGTAGALSLLGKCPDQPIIVTNADLLAKIDYGEMLDYHETSNSSATMAVKDYEYQIPFGVVYTANGKIYELEEKPVRTALVNAGVYVLAPDVIRHVPNNTFFDMPQLFEMLIGMGYITRCFKVHGYWLDIGRYDDFCKANIDYSEVFS